jgi:hypothetical protein
MRKQAENVVVDIEKWPMQACPVAHDFDFR